MLCGLLNFTRLSTQHGGKEIITEVSVCVPLTSRLVSFHSRANFIAALGFMMWMTRRVAINLLVYESLMCGIKVPPGGQ